MLDERLKRGPLLIGISHLTGATENDHRSIVHGMMKRGTGEDQPVEQRHSDTRGCAPDERAEHSTRRRPMNEHLVL